MVILDESTICGGSRPDIRRGLGYADVLDVAWLGGTATGHPKCCNGQND